MSDETTRAPQQDQTYVVQLLRKDFVFEGNEHGSPSSEIEAWVDIATVTVPPRTKRSVVIKKALAEAGIKPGQGDPPKCRALDAESAVVHEPKPRQIEPEWVL